MTTTDPGIPATDAAGTGTDGPSVTMTPVGSWPIDGLADLEGRYLTVQLAPGADAPLHHHEGWQFIYVIDGSVVSQVAGEDAPAEYQAGDAWYEPRRERHLVFRNETERPATVLVFVLTAPDAPVLTFDDPSSGR